MLRSGLHWMVSLVSGGLGRHAAALAVRHHAAARTARTRRAAGADPRADRGRAGCMRSRSRRPVTPRGRPSRSSTGPTTSRTGTACAVPGRRRQIDLDVLMASAAIPFIFPASDIDGESLRRRRDAPARTAESGRAPRRESRAGDRHARQRGRHSADGGHRAGSAEPGAPARLRARLVVHGRPVDRPRAPEPDQPADRRGGPHRTSADPARR